MRAGIRIGAPLALIAIACTTYGTDEPDTPSAPAPDSGATSTSSGSSSSSTSSSSSSGAAPDAGDPDAGPSAAEPKLVQLAWAQLTTPSSDQSFAFTQPLTAANTVVIGIVGKANTVPTAVSVGSMQAKIARSLSSPVAVSIWTMDAPAAAKAVAITLSTAAEISIVVTEWANLGRPDLSLPKGVMSGLSAAAQTDPLDVQRGDMVFAVMAPLGVSLSPAAPPFSSLVAQNSGSVNLGVASLLPTSAITGSTSWSLSASASWASVAVRFPPIAK